MTVAPTAQLKPPWTIGQGTRIGDGARLLGRVWIGVDGTVGANVVIEQDVVIGDRVSIQTGANVTAHSVIEDDVFIGPGVMMANDPFLAMGCLDDRRPFRRGPTLRCGCRIGLGALLGPGVVIGEAAVIGMGAVVLRDVPAGEVWVGNPARRLRTTQELVVSFQGRWQHDSHVSHGLGGGGTAGSPPSP